MSKTDKTRPWRVRVMDKKTWLEEDHDHRDGPCDLPPPPALVCDFWAGRTTTRCYWNASCEFWVTPSNYCGCPTCNDTRGRRLETKRARAQARQRVRQEVQEAVTHGHDDTFDDVAAGFGAALQMMSEFGGGVDGDHAVLARYAEDLDLPVGSHVVDVIHADHLDEPTPVAVEILHADGTRETRYLPGWFVDPIPYEPDPDALEQHSERMHGPR